MSSLVPQRHTFVAAQPSASNPRSPSARSPPRQPSALLVVEEVGAHLRRRDLYSGRCFVEASPSRSGRIKRQTRNCRSVYFHFRPGDNDARATRSRRAGKCESTSTGEAEEPGDGIGDQCRGWRTRGTLIPPVFSAFWAAIWRREHKSRLATASRAV